MKNLSFKKFFESYQKKTNYIDVIQDELGIDPKSLENGSNWASSIKMKNISYNGINYEISRIVKNDKGSITGAMIKPIDYGSLTQRSYLNTKDGSLRRPDSSVSTKEIFISIDKLNTLLSQPLQAGAASQSSLPGMPGML